MHRRCAAADAGYAALVSTSADTQYGAPVDLYADLRATIAHLLECVREATSLDEKGLLADSAARLIAALVEVS